ncbi:MAG: sulfite exporter TauE/SafE family protein [Pseudomonadota bacterium]
MSALEFITYIVLGATVGGFVGTIGVGGGALMTPALIFMGMPVHIAVGTDLLYAGVTKTSGAIAHIRRQHVAWHPLLLLASGSIPSALLTLLFLSYVPLDVFTTAVPLLLGLALIATGLASLALRSPPREARDQTPVTLTVASGVLLGFLVTLTSVGAGAIGAAILLMLFRSLSGARIVGTDLVHAVPLAMIGGLGYALYGYTDWTVLCALLIGSIPAAHVGARMTDLLPGVVIKRIIALLLLVVGGATATVALP